MPTPINYIVPIILWLDPHTQLFPNKVIILMQNKVNKIEIVNKEVNKIEDIAIIFVFTWTCLSCVVLFTIIDTR